MNTLKLFFSLVLFSLFINISLSQDANEFRLRNHLTYHKEKSWEKKVILLEEILDAGLDEIEFELFRIEVEKLYNYTVLKNDALSMNQSRLLLAHVLVTQHNFLEANKILMTTKIYFEKNKNEKYLGLIHRYLGMIQSGQDLDPIALSSFNASIDYYKKCNLPLEYTHSEALAASILIKFKAYDAAEKTIRRCIEFMTKKKKYITVFRYYNMLATIYSVKNENAKEKWANQKSYDYAVKSKNLTVISLAQNNLAIAKYFEGNIDEALKLFHKALETRINNGKIKLICESYFNIAEVYAENNRAKAKEYFNKSRNLAKKENLLTDEGDALLALSGLYDTEKDFKTSQLLLKEYIQVKEKIDELNSKEQIERSNTFNAYEVESVKIGMGLEKETLKRNIKKFQTVVAVMSSGYLILMILYFLIRKRRFNSISKGS